jgi:hypothetical protein
VPIPQGEIQQPVYNDNPFLATGNEDYFASPEDDTDMDLTEEDKRYLRLKWGKTYKPEEWVRLE